MTIEAERRDWFEMSRVVDRAVQTFKSTATAGLALTALLVVAPDLAIYWFGDDAPLAATFKEMLAYNFSLGSSAVGLLDYAASVACQVALVYMALVHMGGKPTTPAEGFSATLRLFLPAVGINILTSIGIVLGLVLLVVPGLMLMTIWVVALPVQVHDRVGVIASIKESGELTKGVRWQVFGLLLATGIILGVLSAIVGLAVRVMPEAWKVMELGLLTPLVTGVATLIAGYGTASLFQELKWGGRHSQEDQAAEVFA